MTSPEQIETNRRNAPALSTGPVKRLAERGFWAGSGYPKKLGSFRKNDKIPKIGVGVTLTSIIAFKTRPKTRVARHAQCATVEGRNLK